MSELVWTRLKDLLETAFALVMAAQFWYKVKGSTSLKKKENYWE